MKILMVCLGNICRSPMAHGLMRDISLERNLDVIIDSAGTADYHTGATPDTRMQFTAKTHGIDISTLTARQFKSSDFEEFDLIYAMDDSNYTNILRLNNGKPHPKVKMMLDESNPGKHLQVPDPYYGGDDGFENVFQLLKEACTCVANRIEDGTYA